MTSTRPSRWLHCSLASLHLARSAPNPPVSMNYRARPAWRQSGPITGIRPSHCGVCAVLTYQRCKRMLRSERWMAHSVFLYLGFSPRVLVFM